MPKGGKRPGAGRPPGQRNPPGHNAGRPPLLQPTEGTVNVILRSPLPCSIKNFDNPNDICGKPATVAYGWPQERSGEWSTPGLWTLQPVCRQCAEAAAKVYAAA